MPEKSMKAVRRVIESDSSESDESASESESEESEG